MKKLDGFERGLYIGVIVCLILGVLFAWRGSEKFPQTRRNDNFIESVKKSNKETAIYHGYQYEKIRVVTVEGDTVIIETRTHSNVIPIHNANPGDKTEEK